MALSEEPMASGSIAEVCDRLRLWASRDDSGLARVAYSSEFSRQQVLQRLQVALAEQDIALINIELPLQRTAPEVVQFLLDKLADIPAGVVSISGLATTFQAQGQLEASLRIVNFNRETLTAFPLRQIWWMTPVILQTSLHAMPDLHGWFSPQLALTESISRDDSSVTRELATRGQSATNNFDDAHQRSRQLLAQLEAAQSAGAADIDLVTTYLLPALESLAEAGVEKELRDLTSQHDELLDSLKFLEASGEKGRWPLNTATNLDRLAKLYYFQGRYKEAESLFLRALTVRKTEPGYHYPDIAASLNNLAVLYAAQERYKEAESLYLEALEISKAELVNQHSYTALILDNLAELYRLQMRYVEAELLYIEILKISKTEMGDRHPDTAISLNNLAGLYESQGRYGEAEPLYVEALKIRKAELGDRHPDTASSLFNLAALYHQTQRPQQALSYIQQALAIYRPTLGSEHPNTQNAQSWLVDIQQVVDEST